VLYDEKPVTWTIVQPKGTSRTYSWYTTANRVGNQVVQVWARSAGSSETDQSWGTSGMFGVVTTPLSTPSLSADAVFPVPSGTPVTWKVQVSGGVAPLQYQVWIFKQGQGWTMARDYAESNTFTWTPGSDGTYVVQAYVRNAGSAAAYDAWTNSGFFTIGGGAPAQGVSLTADRTLPAPAGTTVTWTAVATRGTAGPLQYRFVRLNQATGVWSVVQEYSSSNKFTWITTSGDQGNYLLQMWVKSAGSSAQYEGWVSTGYFTIQ
jgi:hypothetical protein